MDSFLQKKQMCTPQQAAALTESVLQMLIHDMRPLSVVDGAGFQRMIAQFNPDYILLSRTHFTHLMEQKYSTTFLKVKEILKEVNSSLTLTCDVWTSRATEAYLGVSCHFITKEWQMKTLNLATLPLEERHTAANIMIWMEELVKGLQRSIQKTQFESSSGEAFRAIAGKGISERWANLNNVSAERDNPLVLAAAIDPRFRKMKFISPEDGTMVQSTIEVLAIKEAKAETGIHGDLEVQQKRGNVPGGKSALDNLLQSDTDSLSEEEEETQEDKKIQMVRREVQMFFTEPPIAKKDDPLSWFVLRELVTIQTRPGWGPDFLVWRDKS
ncbi:unnamed protein product [Menidia menidia]|uniref:(Atlantic silverside) hypothetical protein n=1 Tax=Menidia menidia TaxID=238744 RepID=A0A8S4AJZ1_9TELE|nr:unnamed protein product [Menidia menidia]